MKSNITTNNAIEKFASLFESQENSNRFKIVNSIKESARADLRRSSFPTLKTEEWKYTNLKPLLSEDYSLSGRDFNNEEITSKIQEYKFPDFDCYTLVVVNGVFVKELSDLDRTNENIFIDSITEVIENENQTISKYFSKISKSKSVFDFLTLSSFTSGLFISVSKNIVLDKPIHVINYIESDSQIYVPNRNLFFIGANSEVSIIQSYIGDEGNGYFNNINTEVVLEENSKLRIYKIEEEASNANHFEKVDVLQNQDSEFKHFDFSFGGKLVRNDINVELEGENIETTLNGLYIGSGKQHIDNNTFINHAKPNCTSNELYKGILDDNSHGVFSGKILVAQDAQHTNAYQNNNTILLSDNAIIDTKPQLEIYADDVKCTHGATVGQLDESAMFYILSRGIPKEVARTMLINAFAESVVEEMDEPKLKPLINNLIAKHLKKKEK